MSLAICCRYALTTPLASVRQARSGIILLRASTATLTASRFRSHSKGAGSVSSKSVRSKIGNPSNVE